MSEKEALLEAIRIVGDQESLGGKMRPPVKQQAVSGWVRRGKCPPERVRQVVAATGGKVSAHELRPDLYSEDAAA